MSNAEAAEFAKLADTTYRDVNIALANEFARYAERVGRRHPRGHRRGQQPAVLATSTSPGSASAATASRSTRTSCCRRAPELELVGALAPGERRPGRVARSRRSQRALGGLDGVPILVLGLTYRARRQGAGLLAGAAADRAARAPGRGRLGLRPAARPTTRSSRAGAVAVGVGRPPAPFRAIVTQTADPRFATLDSGLVPGPRASSSTAATASAAWRCPTGVALPRHRPCRRATAATGDGTLAAWHVRHRQRRRDAAPADQGGGAAAGAPAHAMTRSSSTPASTGTRRWPARSSRSSDCRRPDHSLGVGGGGQAEQTARMLPRSSRSSLAERPDAVLVYGDTNSTLAGALAAAKLAIPVRPRRGRPPLVRPDGCPRRSTASWPTTSRRWLFAPDADRRRQPRGRGHRPTASTSSGTCMQDLAARISREVRIRPCSPASRPGSGRAPRRCAPPGGYLFATVHRAENRDARGDPARGRRCSARSPRPERRSSSPLHPGTRAAIEARRHRASSRDVRVVEPLGLPHVARAPAPRRGRPDRLGRRPARGRLARRAVPGPSRRTEWVEAVADSGGLMVVVGLDVERRPGRARAPGAARPGRADRDRPRRLAGARAGGSGGAHRRRSARRRRASAAGPPVRVVMFVRNDMTVDARVLKEAALAARRRPRRHDRRHHAAGRTARHRARAARRLRDRPRPVAAVAALVALAARAVAPLVDGSVAVDPRPRGRSGWTRSTGSRCGGSGRSAGRGRPPRVAGPADVYHGHDLTGLPGGRRSPGGCTIRRRGLVYDSHELYVDSRGDRRSAGVGRALARPPRAGVVGRGRCARHRQRRLSPTTSGRDSGSRRVVVVHNCPPRPPGRSSGRTWSGSRVGSPPDTRVVLYTGGLRAGRGVDASSPRRCSSRGLERVHLGFLGFGPLARDVEELAADARFGGRIHLLPTGPAARCRSLGRRRPTSQGWRSGDEPELRAVDPEQDVRGVRRRRAGRRERLPGVPRDRRREPGRAARRAVRPRRRRASIAGAIRRILELPPDGVRGDGRARPAGRGRALELGDGVGQAGRALPRAGGRMPSAEPEPTRRRPVPQACTLVLPSSGAFDSRAWRIASALAARGHDVTVLARSEPGLPDREEHPAGYRVIRVPVSAEAGLPKPAAPAGSSLRPRPNAAPTAAADAEPGTTQPEPSPRRGLVARVRAGLGAAWRLAAIALTVRSQRLASRPVAPPADLVHAMAYMGIPIGLDLGRRDGAPVVYDARDIYVHARNIARLPGPARRLFGAVERRWARSASPGHDRQPALRGGHGPELRAAAARDRHELLVPPRAAGDAAAAVPRGPRARPRPPASSSTRAASPRTAASSS